MTDITQNDVTDFATELQTGVPDAAWERIIPYVNQFDLTNIDTDDDRALARIYLAAHLAKGVKLSASGTTAATVGPVTSESVGGVRRSYAFITQTSSESALNTTRYGQRYLELIYMSGCRGPHVI